MRWLGEWDVDRVASSSFEPPLHRSCFRVVTWHQFHLHPITLQDGVCTPLWLLKGFICSSQLTHSQPSPESWTRTARQPHPSLERSYTSA